MQRLRTVTVGPATAAATNNICTSQKPAAGGVQALTLNGSLVSGGVATLDVARRVLITSSSDDSARSFIITGTNRYGNAQTETLQGPATNRGTLKDFKTVTSITVDDDTAGNITIGTSGVISSEWCPVDRYGSQDLGIGVRVTGTVNYTIEEAYQDPFQITQANQVTDIYLTPYPHGSLAAQTANKNGSADAKAITAIRLTINSFSAGGAASADFAPGFTAR